MAVNQENAPAGAAAAVAPAGYAHQALIDFAVAAAFPLGTFFLPPLLILRSGADHALLDLATALTACFCSLQAFVRYQSRPQPMFLWLGAGFLVSGLLDGLHAMVSLQGPDDPGNLGTRTWVASSLLLGVYLVIGLARFRDPATARGAHSQETLVGGVTAGTMALLLPALMLLPPTQVIWQKLPLHRPYEALPALIMLLAVWRVANQQRTLGEALRERMSMAVALYLSVHAGMMAWSSAPLDEFVAMSHLAKFVAHWLVAVGLLQSSANLLAEAEGARQQLAAQAFKLETQEQKIQQALTLTTMILDHTSVAIYSTDPTGVVTRFNQTAQRWLGYTEGEVCGRLTPAVFHDRDELARYAEAISRSPGVGGGTGIGVQTLLAMPRAGYPEHREWNMIRKDGTRFPASVSVVPLEGRGGEIHGFVWVANDLSHQKEVERLKNEFVSTVSHELRTPLTSIRGSLGLLAGGVAGVLPTQAKSLLDIAQRNAERLILLVNDILDIEKIEAGKMRFTFKSLDLDALVAEALQNAEGHASTRHVRLVKRVAAPGLRVLADEQRLLQVMANLLSNAIKYSTEGGSVEVDVREDAGLARVKVTDHGAGIPEGSQSRIFQKFFQADSSTAREKGGTGLGLSICKALIERMDGRMAFSSRPGTTVFEFNLPAERVRLPAPRPARAEAAVLVVEDDFAMGELLRRLLEDIAPVTVTRTVAQTREQMARQQFALAIIDIGLPDGSGRDLIPLLRESQPGIGIVVFSEQAMPEEAARQVAAILSKSRTRDDDLVATVKQLLAGPGGLNVKTTAASHPAG